MRGWLKVALMCGVVLAIAFHPTMTFECGGSWPEPVFVTQEPANVDYVSGNLGVIRGSFSTQNLFIAYRTISGAPLSNKEAQALTNPLPNDGVWLDSYYGSDKNPYYDSRAKVQGVPGVRRPNTVKDAGEYNYYLNCGADAFQVAADTLRDRGSKYGMRSGELLDWIAAQDQVFENCDRKEVKIPPPAAAGASAAFKADREYQIAAANFYSENYDEAAQLFQKIAGDQSSQWHDWGLYLAARSYIRKATLKSADGQADVPLKQAEELLRRTRAQTANPEMKAKSDSLISFVEFRLDPKKRSGELGKVLAKSSDNPTFHQNVRDYLKLIRKVRGDEDEMADWIVMLHESSHDDDGMPLRETRDNGMTSEVIRKWQREPKLLPWLIAALMKADGHTPVASELISAGLKVPANSPAYATARYNAARLLSEQGKRVEVRKLLDDYMKSAKDLPLSSANMMLALRTANAATLKDFAAFSTKDIAATRDYYMEPDDGPCTADNGCPKAMWDNEAARTINHLSIKDLLALSKIAAAPERVRTVAVRMAFTRAMMLNDDAALRASAQALSNTKQYGKDVQRVISAPTATERRTEAVLAVMGWPFISYTIKPEIDFDRGSEEDAYGGWWCGGGENNFFGAPTGLANPNDGYPVFLSASDRQEAEKQLKQLVDSQAAPDLFGEVTLAWAKQKPSDPRVPQALRRVVRAVHFACGGPKANGYSKEAFDRLHSKYPNSDETRRTKHWYKTRTYAGQQSK